MKGHVEAVCPSQFSGELDEIPPAIEVENPVTFTLVAVFLDDLQRHVQQADGRGRFGLLAPDVYPVRSVVRLRDVFFGQAFQVGVGQPREGSEEKPVPHPLEVGFTDGSFHQFFEVFEFQMAALAPGQFRVQLPVRVAPECTLTDSPLGHFFQPVKMLVYCLGFHFTICTQEYFKIIVELPVKAPQRYILLFLPFFHEGG